MHRDEVIFKVRPFFAEHLEKEGFVLVDLRFYKNQERDLIFEILADRQEGGITLDECARLNKELGVLLERSGYFQERYTLDVSSPGMDRPLVVFSDFRRVLGRWVRVFLREALEGSMEYEGAVESVGEDKIILKTENKTIEIPYDKVNKAKQVILSRLR